MLMDQLFPTLQSKKKERLRDFISGFIAGIISVSICNPLDITRTRLNLMSSSKHIQKYHGFTHAVRCIWRQEGIHGFFTGYKINIKAIPIFHSIFFPVYEYMKDYCKSRNFTKSQQYLTSAIVAGSFCNIVTNPIWVVRTRVMGQALRPYKQQYLTSSIVNIIKSIVHQEGINSLFKGVTASILGVSNPVIYFYIYQNFRQRFVQSKSLKFNSFYVFCSSILAKSISSTITFPLLVVRTIMQDSRGNNKGDRHKMIEVLKNIINNFGIKGLYSGLKPDLLRILPSNTIVFLVYEFMKKQISIKEDN